MNTRIWQAWWLALLLLPTLARAVDVQATLDRSTAQLGDTVTLNLRINGAGGSPLAAPDLSALNQDFEILGTSQNNSLSVVNGVTHANVTFGVALRPRHVGTLQIPALSVDGQRTAPLQLQVRAADPTTAAADHAGVFLESRVEPAEGYVGQQLNYVVKLFYAVRLTDGSLQLPGIKQAQVSQLGDDVRYQTERDGVQYNVIERRYAVFPQQAGVLTIPAAQFQGDAVDPNNPDSFFSTGAPVSASAPPQQVTVQAIPASWGKHAWLPARALSLTLDGWPVAGDSLRVGQPLNLSMTLQATGLSQEALPALSLPALDGATVYPDKPVGSTQVDGQWLVGRHQQSFAVVPERPGTLTIPATTLSWWNVLTGQQETAQIPAHSFTVLPAIGAPAVTPAAPATGTAAGEAGRTTVTATRPVTAWRWIAVASLGLWLLSMLAWLLWRRRRPAAATAVTAASPEIPSARQAQQAFIAASQGEDAAAQARSLLAWARAERPAIRHLGELAQALADDRQQAAVASLQQRQYGAGTAGEGLGRELAAAFKPGFRWRAPGGPGTPDDLPPLYPFELK